METFEVRRPPQTEYDERRNLIDEIGCLCGQVMQQTGTLPSVIRDLMLKDEAPNLFQLSSLQLADLCADIRSEYPGLPREANERR